MRHFKIITLAATALMTLLGCQKPRDFGPAAVKLDKESIEFESDGGKTTLSLDATVDWKIEGYVPEVKAWLYISEESGKASSNTISLELSTLKNPDKKSRSVKLIFNGGSVRSELAISQKGLGQPVTPAKVEKLSIADFIKKPVNTKDWYQLNGKITNISNTLYGNFTIKDDTGSILIYGMTSEYLGYNDQSFSQIGLKEGDEVTLNTLRSEYGGSAQGGGSEIPAYYVSHKEGTPDAYPTGSIILSFPDDNKANNGLTSDHYVKEWTATKGEHSWKIKGFNNNNWSNWTYIRCGRKAEPSLAHIISDALPKVSQVIVVLNSYTKADVNSVKLQLYSDAALTQKVGEAIQSSKAMEAGENTFAIPASSQKDKLYYQLLFDCKVSSASKNGFVELSKVVYVTVQ